MKSRISLFIMVLIFTALACGGPATSPEPSIPEDTSTEESPQATSYSTQTLSPTAIHLPATQTLTSVPTNTPSIISSNTPTMILKGTATKTPLPPLPDFDKVLSFGGGGGGDMDPCAYAGYQPAVFGDSSYGMGWQQGILCVWGVGFGQPFSLRLISPDGKITLIGNYYVDQRTWNFEWQGYTSNDFHAVAAWTENGTRVDIDILWPFDLSLGTWQLIGDGEDFIAYSSLVVNEEYPEIPRVLAYDSRFQKEIIPVKTFLGHTVQPNPDGSINIKGKNFSGNSTVFLLLYEDVDPNSPWPHKAVMTHQQAVVTDRTGYFSTQILAPITLERTNVIVGVEAGQPLMVDGYLNSKRTGSDSFYIRSGVVTVNSCPNAPPQRMIVNQYGYVCTHGDNVRLRNAPARSANTVISLPVGSQFMVIGGPSCADDWSWWQIRTDNGSTGWIAEGGDKIDPYFICPSQ